MQNNKDNEFASKLSKLPKPESGTDQETAYELIDSVLNLMLNKHIHALERNGYLKASKYHHDYGWEHDTPKKALQMKFDLMDEAIMIFSPQIVEKLRNVRINK